MFRGEKMMLIPKIRWDAVEGRIKATHRRIGTAIPHDPVSKGSLQRSQQDPIPIMVVNVFESVGDEQDEMMEQYGSGSETLGDEPGSLEVMSQSDEESDDNEEDSLDNEVIGPEDESDDECPSLTGSDSDSDDDDDGGAGLSKSIHSVHWWGNVGC